MENTELFKDGAFTHVNEVILVGPIVRKYTNDVACNLTIKTPRLNMPNITKGGEASYNYPEVAFYTASAADADKFNEGDVVEIHGMIQPKKKIAKETGREYYNQKLIGMEIKPAEKVLQREFGIDDGNPVESKNLVRLAGVVSKIATPSEGVISLNIRTFVNGRVNNIQTFMYDRNVGKYMEKYRVGDRVVAVATIQTLKKKINDDQDKYYRNVVLSALYKVEE